MVGVAKGKKRLVVLEYGRGSEKNGAWLKNEQNLRTPFGLFFLTHGHIFCFRTCQKCLQLSDNCVIQGLSIWQSGTNKNISRSFFSKVFDCVLNFVVFNGFFSCLCFHIFRFLCSSTLLGMAK